MEVLLPYDEYPDLIQNAFKVTEKQDIESLVAETEGEGVEVEPQEESALFDMITIANPTWEKYCNVEDTHDDATFISLTQTKEDKSDWLDSEVWAAENGFDVVYLPYSDGTYYYRPEMAIEYDYMYNELMIMSDDQETVLYDYDLSVLGNGPDEKDGKYSGTTQYIRWAQVVDDVVYVSIGHNGYATEEPLSNYMVAIDLNTNEVIWRSEPCVSNARNFKIVGDTIICGYGFTAEPDYIYLLNRYTGDVVSSTKVNSAPEQFEIVDDTLYVATYNTAYEYKIN